MWLRALVAVLILYASKKIIAFRNAAQSVGNIPGFRTLISRDLLLSFFVPRIPGVAIGPNWAFNLKHSVYAQLGHDMMTLVSAFPCQSDIVIADAATIKEITTHRGRFPKPVELYEVLSYFGFNIVASEGDDWKKYRKISAPAFSERNNKLVWDETLSIMNDLFDNVWGDKEAITIDHCLDLTMPLAMFVISAAGFGQKLTWTGGTIIPPGHKMTFKDSLYTVSTFVIHRLISPDWVLALSKKTRNVALGFNELKMYLTEMIHARLKSDKVERDDLFSNLLDESNVENDGLTTDELIGNIFIFLLAGHETTAHSLCFTLGLLALYQDEQEKLYQEIKSIVPNPNHLPTYDQIPLLSRTMAVFNESLRMFPAVVLIPKRNAEDTRLSTTNAQGETMVVPLPKNTNLILHVTGLHYNPKYWEDPHEFRPDRFLGNWNRDAFIPFSAGPRACLGRRFAELEVLASLTMLISKYKITVKEEPQFVNETFEQRKERILKAAPGITLTPVKVPLTFTRRKM